MKAGDVIAVFDGLKACHEEDGEKLFFLAADGRTRSSGFKLQPGSYGLNLPAYKENQRRNELPAGVVVG